MHPSELWSWVQGLWGSFFTLELEVLSMWVCSCRYCTGRKSRCKSCWDTGYIRTQVIEKATNLTEWYPQWRMADIIVSLEYKGLILVQRSAHASQAFPGIICIDFKLLNPKGNQLLASLILRLLFAIWLILHVWTGTSVNALRYFNCTPTGSQWKLKSTVGTAVPNRFTYKPPSLAQSHMIFF